ncbi:hypothetical protein LRS04_14950 [Phenylobacterium sp. J367]|nr:hypothetical protein [Phenylobacterium sp. J367]MCR5879484.1 hypothetical protein [Phenylobacterium sp. J367]
MVSCGSQASVAPAPRRELAAHLGVAARRTVDPLAGLGRDGQLGAFARLGPPGQAVAARQAAGGVDQHRLQARRLGAAGQADLGAAVLVEPAQPGDPVMPHAHPSGAAGALQKAVERLWNGTLEHRITVRRPPGQSSEGAPPGGAPGQAPRK